MVTANWRLMALTFFALRHHQPGEVLGKMPPGGFVVKDIAEKLQGISNNTRLPLGFRNHSNTSTKRPEELDMAQMGFFDVEKRLRRSGCQA